MKIIDLLNKIANNGVNDEIQYIEYFNRINAKNDICMLCYENLIHKLDCGQLDINDEVEILEEEKKIPEKIQKDDFEGINEEESKLWITIRKINEIIDCLDYLKNKGE